jgi:hypothetical protein
MEIEVPVEASDLDKEAAYCAFIGPLSRYIHNENLLSEDPETVMSRFLKDREVTDDYIIEIHPTALDAHKRAIEHAIEDNQYLSAAILIAISLEEDINGLIRIGCNSKGFTHKKITKYISEISLKTKIELIFPLLGVKFPEKYRIAIYEYLPFRNSVVHGKSIPSFHTHKEDTFNSIESNQKKAENLISSYPLKRLEELSLSLDREILEIPELKHASNILTKHLYG